MNADDLATVQRTWERLRPRRNGLLVALAWRFGMLGPPAIDPEQRARWLFDAVAELVGLLATPSALAERARILGASWPDPHTAPCYAAEGRAWLDAAEVCLPGWTAEDADAWKQAWLLLSDVLAAETLSPFAAGEGASDQPPAPPSPPSPGSTARPAAPSSRSAAAGPPADPRPPTPYPRTLP